MPENINVPTLLIGLGGLGSKIVDEVYHKIPANRRSKVAVHTFDTNISDIKKLKYLTENDITQTSAPFTVRQYLAETESTVLEWFPDEQTEILRKSLTDGAGQVRSVSRLALRACLKNGNLFKLEKAITKLFYAEGSEYSSTPRVMIVNTLAGGTGAGIFLQISLLIRDILLQSFQRENILIKGAFLLPDTLVKTGEIKNNQIKNVYSNAYACMKELYALTRNASNINESLNIELEYSPNQVKQTSEDDIKLVWQNLPFDYVTLFDFENQKNENLGKFPHYISQVVNFIYLDLFSPISKERFSKQDNEIISMIEGKGLNRFSGGGVSRLVYPYKDIINYLSLRWVYEGITNDWLKADQNYTTELKMYEDMLNQGDANATEPDKRISYISFINNMARSESPKPFFRKVYRENFILDSRGNEISSKASNFINTLSEYISQVSSNDEDLNQLDSECYIKDEIKNRDTAVSAVVDMEEALIDYESGIKKFINKVKGFVKNQITIADGDHPNQLSGESFKLNTVILGGGKAMHPVAVRYFIYDLDLELERALGKLQADNKSRSEAINRYKTAYDPDPSDDVEITAEDRMEVAISQGFLNRSFSFKNKFKEFVEEYEESSEQQYRNLKAYRVAKLQQEVFSSIRTSLVELINNLERYFNSLNHVSMHFKKELNLLAIKHDQNSDPSTQYVLASKLHKDKLWENISLSMITQSLPSDISAQIYKGQYIRFCKQMHEHHVSDEKPEKVAEMLKSDAVAWCYNHLKLNDELNLNAFRALEKQFEINGIEEDEINEECINMLSKLDELAVPFVPKVKGIENTTINAWGVNPETLVSVPKLISDELISGEIISDPAFSEYEIVRSRTVYGMEITDFPKFFSGGDISRFEGNYYKAYHERIKRIMEHNDSITPHLDKRWHLSTYLPEIEDNLQTNKEIQRRKFIYHGLASGTIRQTNKDDSFVWQINNDGVMLDIKSEHKNVEFMSDLYDAVASIPQMYESVKLIFNNKFETDKTAHNQSYEKYDWFLKLFSEGIYTGASKSKVNIIDLYLWELNDPTKPSDEKVIIINLLQDTITFLREDLQKIFGLNASKKVNQTLKTIFNAAKNNSTIYNEAKELSETRNTIDAIVDSI